MTICIDVPRGFRLQSAADFYADFIPGSGMAAAATDGLTLSFRLDRTFEATVVRLGQAGRTLRMEVFGTENLGSARAQVARILGLEADADAWAELGERNPVVAKLKAEFPGFFTATKPSPYDAAVWAILAPRVQMRAAAAVKLAMMHTLGDRVSAGDSEHHVFPGPAVLATLEAFPGVPAERVERLRGIGRAALEGKLDATTLREMPEDAALHELQKLRGVGPWAASHIYFRGAAPIDALPTVEPRVLHGLADVLAVSSISPADFRLHAGSWRPFRMWVSVLLSRHLARTGGWRSPALAREREIASRALSRRTRSATASSR